MDNAWENFLEAIAALMSKALMDKENEKVIAHCSKFPNFQERLHRLSSHNLQRLHLEILQREKQASKCKYEGKTCAQNVARGFFKTWTVAYAIKYLIGVLPALLAGKAFKRPYHEGDRLNAFVAGSIAGLALLLDKNKSRRIAITLSLFTRFLQFGSNYLMKKWAEQREAKKSIQNMALRDAVKFSGKEQALATTSGWDDILARIMSSSAATTLMSVACSINFYAFMIEPDALPKSYWSFCMQHSGLPEKFGPTVHTVMETFRAQ
ncbi:hypothetical protein BGX23_001704 [Mortierella sp. AD031]|nr:hypothetical protein BGX23_001704 [Mortierella sp. AD031]